MGPVRSNARRLLLLCLAASAICQNQRRRPIPPAFSSSAGAGPARGAAEGDGGRAPLQERGGGARKLPPVLDIVEPTHHGTMDCEHVYVTVARRSSSDNPVFVILVDQQYVLTTQLPGTQSTYAMPPLRPGTHSFRSCSLSMRCTCALASGPRDRNAACASKRCAISLTPI